MRFDTAFSYRPLLRSLLGLGLFVVLASADTGCTATLFMTNFRDFTPGTATSFPETTCQGNIDLSRMRKQRKQLKVLPSGELRYRNANVTVADRHLGFVARSARFDQPMHFQWLITPSILATGSKLVMQVGNAQGTPLTHIQFDQQGRIGVRFPGLVNITMFGSFSSNRAYRINLTLDPTNVQYQIKVTEQATGTVVVERVGITLIHPSLLTNPDRLALWFHYPDNQTGSSCRIQHVAAARKNPEPVYACADRRRDWYPREFAFESFEYLGREGQVVASLSPTACEVPLDASRAKRVETSTVGGEVLNRFIYDVRVRVRRTAQDPTCGQGTYRLRTISRSVTVTSNLLSDLTGDALTDLSWLPTEVGVATERTFEVRFQQTGGGRVSGIREYYLCNEATVNALRQAPASCLAMTDFLEAHQRVKPAGEPGDCAGIP